MVAKHLHRVVGEILDQCLPLMKFMKPIISPLCITIVIYGVLVVVVDGFREPVVLEQQLNLPLIPLNLLLQCYSVVILAIGMR